MTAETQQNNAEVGTPTLVVNKLSVVYDTPTSDKHAIKKLSILRKVWNRLLGKTPRVKVTAVDDVSFVARTGEFIGLLGQNGAGKSTILRIIAGVEMPASGTIKATSQPVLLGVSAALLPELSGAENARLGCLAMGMTPQEAEAALPDITAFASLGNALYRPMKTYSSGMAARLRFAISTASRPRILLIDEALSTGDATFARKSEERMNEMLENAGTIFLVSHTPSLIQKMCNRAIWLHNGEILADGPASKIAEHYRWWAWFSSQGETEKAEARMQKASELWSPQRIEIQ